MEARQSMQVGSLPVAETLLSQLNYFKRRLIIKKG
ncbi:hypothetical protein FIV00_05670 [Labrenzia sp. THAF82]|nr:hypothetical protein FIV00_05670 [Labrenzia sp. THAF82]